MGENACDSYDASSACSDSSMFEFLLGLAFVLGVLWFGWVCITTPIRARRYERQKAVQAAEAAAKRKANDYYGRQYGNWRSE